MTLNLANYEIEAKEAVMAFWKNRDKAARENVENGTPDAGTRGAVTNGKNMDGFLKLIIDVVRKNGLTQADIYYSKPLFTLPGYFRPTKQWDLLIMAQKTREDVARRVNVTDAKRLRTRLMALRYYVLSHVEEFRESFDEAWEIAEKPVISDVGELELDDRTIDMVANIIIAPLVLDRNGADYADDLQLFAASQRKAKESLADSFPGQSFHALLEVLVFKKGKPALSEECDVGDISTTDVADQLNKDLREQGNSRQNPIVTTKVGNALREMNFATKPGSGNKSYFVQKYDQDDNDTIFYPNLWRNLRKYGSGGLDLSELKQKKKEVNS